MASLSFEGETHDEIVLKVRRWLQSTEGASEDLERNPEVRRAYLGGA